MGRANSCLAAIVLLACGCATVSRPAPPPPTDPFGGLVKITATEPREIEFLRKTLDEDLRSPSAREWAVEIASSGVAVEISLADVQGSTIGVWNGVAGVTVKGGETITNDEGRPTIIHLNRLELRAPEDAPENLAHELFGHARDWGRSFRDGSYPAYRFADSSELNAKLAGWIVAFERGDRASEREAEEYLSDTAHYRDHHRFDAPSSPVGLTRAEMKDARAAYRARLRELDDLRADAEKGLENRKNELDWIDHFVEVHKLPARRFEAARAQIRDGALADIRGRLAILDAAEPRLEENLKQFETGKNNEIMRAVANDPGVLAWDAETKDLTARLRKALAALPAPKAPAPASSAAAGSEPSKDDSISWSELSEMIRKDAALCPYGYRP